MNEIFPQDLYLGQNGSGVLNEVNQDFNNEIEGLLDKFAGNRPNANQSVQNMKSDIDLKMEQQLQMQRK